MTKAFSFQAFGLWPPRRGARIDSVNAEADALIRDFGAAAYSEARRREHEASSDAIAKDWERVALAIARKLTADTGSLDSERMAARVALVPDRDPASPSSTRSRRIHESGERAGSSVESTHQLFRIQYAGPKTGEGPSILKEVEVQVANVSAAIVEAANLIWPRGTTALRILDHDGREVFERHRAGCQ